MARYLGIRCIVKAEGIKAHERIEAICGMKPDGSHWSLTHDSAVAQAEDGVSAFYIERAGGRRFGDLTSCCACRRARTSRIQILRD